MGAFFLCPWVPFTRSNRGSGICRRGPCGHPLRTVAVNGAEEESWKRKKHSCDLSRTA